MSVSILQTPIGSLVIEANDTEVYFVGFDDDIKEESPNAVSEKAKHQLTEYFDGKRSQFDFPITR